MNINESGHGKKQLMCKKSSAYYQLHILYPNIQRAGSKCHLTTSEIFFFNFPGL